MRILKNKVLSVGTERLPTWRRTNVFFSNTTYMEEGFKLWLQRLRLACILPKHSSTVDLFLIAQPWGIPPPLPRQTRTHITLLSPQSRFLIPSIILHFCLPASFFLTIPFGLIFCLLCSLCGRISPVTGIQHLLFCLPFVSHPSLWFCLALGAGCDSVKGEWALLCSTSPTLQL